MRSFKKFVLESVEQAELDEAVEVRHDRYMRSHGKKASGGTGSWMFTHKAMGDVDYNNEKEVHTAPRGKFSDAKKSAQQWAKKHGHSTVYVMESVELDEKLKASDDMGTWVKDFQKSDAPQFKGKSQKERQKMAIAAKLAAERNEEVELDEQAMTFQNAEKLKNKHLVAMDHHKKSGNSKGYAAHSMVVRKFEDAYDRHGTGVIPAGRILSASQKAFKDHPHSGMKESVELDEVSDKMLDRYRQKAFADQPAGDDGSDKYRKRKFGRDLAFAKQTGRAKVLATKESVDLDEAVTVKKKDYSWGKMMTVHHGYSHSFPLHPEHQEKIKKLGDGEKTSFRDETGSAVTAHREGDKIHLKTSKANQKTTVARSHFTEAVMQGSKEHLKKLQDMLDKVKPGSADHSQIRGAIESKFGKQHIPAKHRNVKPDMYEAKETFIPLSHVKKHVDAGKKVQYHVLHNGRDAAGRFDDYASAKKGASEYRSRMRKMGYDHTGVKIHPVVLEEVELTESHFKVGDRVKCIRSGMFGEVIKIDKPEVGKYYTVKQDSGKVMKYSPEELKKV